MITNIIKYTKGVRYTRIKGGRYFYNIKKG